MWRDEFGKDQGSVSVFIIRNPNLALGAYLSNTIISMGFSPWFKGQPRHLTTIKLDGLQIEQDDFHLC